jgi:hypothetical protein
MSILTPVRDDQSAPRDLSISCRTGFRASCLARGPVRPGRSHLFCVALPRRGSGIAIPDPGTAMPPSSWDTLPAQPQTAFRQNRQSVVFHDVWQLRLQPPMALDDLGLPCHMSIPDDTERVLDGSADTPGSLRRVSLEPSAAASEAAGPLTSFMLATRILHARMPRNLSPISTGAPGCANVLRDIHRLRKPTNPGVYTHIPTNRFFQRSAVPERAAPPPMRQRDHGFLPCHTIAMLRGPAPRLGAGRMWCDL